MCEKNKTKKEGKGGEERGREGRRGGMGEKNGKEGGSFSTGLVMDKREQLLPLTTGL